MKPLYDRIGVGYANRRQPDNRIAARIYEALGTAQTVLNVGAGTGSYEPADRAVTALEPSAEMIRQRRPGLARAHQGVAEDMPFASKQFDAAMAVLTVHHWSDFGAGLREMRRVTKGRLVILTFDPAGPYFWLADYFPEIITLDQPIMPRLSAFEEVLGPITVQPVPVPHDCTDGFLGAYWRRPEAYLDPAIRSAISTFAKMADIAERLALLKADLASGSWTERYGDLMMQDSLDIGYRLVVAD